MKHSGSSTRDLLHFAWPVLVAQLALMANSVIDTAMAGRLSAVDLAAVGIGGAIMGTVVVSLISVLLALPPIVAHLYGAGERAAIGRELHQSVWIGSVLALVAILLLVFPAPFIALAQLQPAVEEKVRAYLAASAWGVPAAIALRLFFGLSTGIGRPRPVMLFNLLSLTLKIPLNAVFMYGLLGLPAMGAAGCAMATALDAWLMALLAWSWCLNHPEYAEFKLRARFTLPERAAIKEFLRLGIPSALTFIADVTAFTFMALFIARLGPAVSGAHQIAANLAAFAFMFPISVGNATAVLAGQAMGAGDPQRARRICGRGIRLGMATALVISTTCWLAAPNIAALYTTDLRVQAVAIPLITLVGFYHLGDALQAVAVNALRGYKKSSVPMVIYAVALWGVGLAGGVLLGLTDMLGPARGAPGFWLAAIGGIWLAAGLVALYLNAVSRAKLEEQVRT
jgi:MATE family multidrug resistance protein